MRLDRRRWHRRRFLTVTGATGAGAAGLLLVGCGDDDDDDDDDDAPDTATSTGTTVTTATAAPTDAPTDEPTSEETEEPTAEPTEAGGSVKRGGVIALNAAIDTVDSFDTQRARFGPIHGLMAQSMSRIVEYKDPDGFELGGDLAASWEQPDDVTTIFELKPNIVWHNKPPVNGRAFTVEDIVYYVERQKAGLDNRGPQFLPPFPDEPDRHRRHPG
jgi:peptide/nickel transport system substrate-binding protein